MFLLKPDRRGPTPKTQAGKPPGTEIDSTFINAGTKIGGDLTGIGNVRIDGEVGGNVYGLRVSLGIGGIVMGDIYAEVAYIAGRVHGRIEAVSVFLAKSAAVAGTIIHNQIDIEPGAKLDSLRPWRPPSYFVSPEEFQRH